MPDRNNILTYHAIMLLNKFFQNILTEHNPQAHLVSQTMKCMLYHAITAVYYVSDCAQRRKFNKCY